MSDDDELDLSFDFSQSLFVEDLEDLTEYCREQLRRAFRKHGTARGRKLIDAGVLRPSLDFPPAPDPPRHRIPVELDVEDVSDREGEPAVEIAEPWPDGAKLQVWDSDISSYWHVWVDPPVPWLFPTMDGPVIYLDKHIDPADVRVFFVAVKWGGG